MELSVEFWRWKYCREFGNNTKGRARLWDSALNPVLQITSPDHLDVLPGCACAGALRDFLGRAQASTSMARKA